LGAGKTTFIKYIMDYPPEGEKLVVIVNEFGEVGVDGIILSDQKGLIADVVELPSGCICCTLSSDFRRQFLEVHERFRPDRIIVEPTGVAMISQIQQILGAEDLRNLYSDINLIHILDGAEFLNFIKRQRHFMENQLRRSRLVILNKMDRVKPHMVELLVQSVAEINPDAEVYPTSFGQLDSGVVKRMLGLADGEIAGPPDLEVPEEEHEHGHDFAAQFLAFGKKYEAMFDRECLQSFFESLKNREYGEVVRAKGVFRTQKEWIKLELASGEVRLDPVPAASESVVSIIGTNIDTTEMEQGLISCQA
jgi:G3E family GTPase